MLKAWPLGSLSNLGSFSTISVIQGFDVAGLASGKLEQSAVSALSLLIQGFDVVGLASRQLEQFQHNLCDPRV